MWTKFVKITPFKTLFILLLLLTLLPSGTQAQLQMAAAAEAEQACYSSGCRWNQSNPASTFSPPTPKWIKKERQNSIEFQFLFQPAHWSGISGSDYQPHILSQLQKTGYGFHLCSVQCLHLSAHLPAQPILKISDGCCIRFICSFLHAPIPHGRHQCQGHDLSVHFYHHGTAQRHPARTVRACS